MEFVVSIVLLVMAFLVTDYLRHILPETLKKIAWKKLSRLKPEVRDMVYQGFLNDCKNQKSSVMEYWMIINFIITARNIEIPQLTETEIETEEKEK